MDLLAWPNLNENYANNSTAVSKRTFHAAAASQLDCAPSHDLENVQVCGRTRLVDVFAQCKYKFLLQNYSKHFQCFHVPSHPTNPRYESWEQIDL